MRGQSPICLWRCSQRSCASRHSVATGRASSRSGPIFLAETVAAFLDALERLVDLADQFAAAVASAQFQRVLGFARGAELRDAAQRNLRLEEEQRRRIATEIHDELGQNLTAVHTRVKLAADRLNAAQLGDVTTSIYEILATMRGSVRGLMDSLRPPVLDEFGLVRALREGPLRDLAERAGLRYEFDLRGDPALIAALDEATQIAIWRIVQEAATNTVRHAHATCFRARLRVGVRNANALAILDLRDDGIGIADATAASRGGHGLQGMRDRALALNGVMRVAGNPKGTQLRVLLRQAL